MQAIIEQKAIVTNESVDLTPENLSDLVCAFAWLINEDKKQNPELYKLK